MKKILSFLFSNRLTVVLLFVFGLAMAVATFVENDHGTLVARQLIYGAWWFEVIILLITLNFIGNIYRYRLLRREKIPVFLFHLAFVVIVLGAAVTRYTSQEGIVRIREGQSSDQMISQERYFQLQVKDGNQQWRFEQKMDLSKFRQPHLKYETGGTEPLVVTSSRFVPQANQVLVPGDQSDALMEIVAVVDGNREQFYLNRGGSVFVTGHEFTFDNPKSGAVNLTEEDGNFMILSPESLNFIVMSTQQVGRLTRDSINELRFGALYQSDHLNFVIKTVHKGQKLDFEAGNDQQAADLLFVHLKTKQEEKTVVLAAVDGVFVPKKPSRIGGYEVEMVYGPKKHQLPFALHLADFQLERYPGSVSPSSYASEVIVKDSEGDFPVRISMNNVLDHRGYRFFQASYDLDERGTVLSVNRDFIGKQVTYLGYFLLCVGMVWTLFGRQSRFRTVARKLDRLKAVSAVVLMLISTVVFAQQQPEGSERLVISAAHAEKFGELMVQDMDGRIKPINTLSSEFLRKLTRKSSFSLTATDQKLSADQVFLSLHQAPAAWSEMPLIKVDPDKANLILEELGLKGFSMLTYTDLVDEQGGYRLEEAVQAAQRKKPSERSEQDKELIKIDERFNILYQALSGNYLKIFPQPTAADDMWFNPNFSHAGFRVEDSLFVRNIMAFYFTDVASAQMSGDWTAAEEKLAYIKTFQQKMGERVIPPAKRVRAELLYNKFKIFNHLFSFYWLAGCFMLGLAIVKIFVDNKLVRALNVLGVFVLGLAFLAQTANMILRWYAGGYPPWSNGYEMIILVSWALFLFGFIFYKKSDFVMPMVAFFGGTLLFVAFLDWLNPEITNLVPVLKSYWLKIHVAVIVSSYAPLALSALLGLLVLIFMSINAERFTVTIAELTYINELSMTIGLFMLSIGTFLGGVWANESWGRYWAWDPKETWALISMMVYAIVLHLRLVPHLRSKYLFNLASVVAFASIIMTSFGVNYYLSGLHSYATGDPVPIPDFVYWSVGIVVLLGLTAYLAPQKDQLKTAKRGANQSKISVLAHAK